MWIHLKNESSLWKFEFHPSFVDSDLWLEQPNLCVQNWFKQISAKFFDLLQIPWHSIRRLKRTNAHLNLCNMTSLKKNSVFSSLITSTATARHSRMNRLCKWEDHYASIYLVSLRKRFSVCLTKQKTPNAIRFYSVERMCSRQMLFLLNPAICVFTVI